MIELTGLRMRNPTILAAGILGSMGSSLKRVADSGAGGVVTKSLGIEARPGYPNPTLIETECGFLNAMGLPNPSYMEFSKELEIAKEAGIPVIASIFGSGPEEFREIAGGLPNSDAFELNLSCPHAKEYGSEVGTDPILVEEITREVKYSVKKPVWVKLTPNVSDITEIGLAAQRGGADAIVAINTLRGMAIDLDSGYPILGNKFGGLSGPGIKPIAVKAVYDLYEVLDIPIIGCGGISKWEDAVEMILAGASAVEIGSAVFYGLEIFKKIAEGIEDYLSKKGYALEDILGLAHEA